MGVVASPAPGYRALPWDLYKNNGSRLGYGLLGQGLDFSSVQLPEQFVFKHSLGRR